MKEILLTAIAEINHNWQYLRISHGKHDKWMGE
jgi:hypothetical protein